MTRAGGFIVLAGLALLSACGGEQQAGGVTADEAKQLNEAAEMLDVQPDSLAATEEAALGNGEAGSSEADDAAVAELNASTNGQ